MENFKALMQDTPYANRLLELFIQYYEELFEKLPPNVELCVLQLPLTSGRPRTGVDREKAGLMRSFAAELHAVGLPATVS